MFSEDEKIKNSLRNAKTIAMVGVSSVKKEESFNVVRKPSIIVMNYLQEFGYKVIPVNPFALGKKINKTLNLGDRLKLEYISKN